jgi:hypothetical protein
MRRGGGQLQVDEQRSAFEKNLHAQISRYIDNLELAYLVLPRGQYHFCGTRPKVPERRASQN